MTRTIHPHTRRRERRDRVYANRMHRLINHRPAYDPHGPARYVDRRGRPLELLQWAALFENANYLQVAFTNFGDGYSVSTIWLGQCATPWSVARRYETLAGWPGYPEITIHYPTERLARIGHYGIARLCEVAYRQREVTA